MLSWNHRNDIMKSFSMSTTMAWLMVVLSVNSVCCKHVVEQGVFQLMVDVFSIPLHPLSSFSIPSHHRNLSLPVHQASPPSTFFHSETRHCLCENIHKMDLNKVDPKPMSEFDNSTISSFIVHTPPSSRRSRSLDRVTRTSIFCPLSRFDISDTRHRLRSPSHAPGWSSSASKCRRSWFDTLGMR